MSKVNFKKLYLLEQTLSCLEPYFCLRQRKMGVGTWIYHSLLIWSSLFPVLLSYSYLDKYSVDSKFNFPIKSIFLIYQEVFFVKKHPWPQADFSLPITCSKTLCTNFQDLLLLYKGRCFNLDISFSHITTPVCKTCVFICSLYLILEAKVEYWSFFLPLSIILIILGTNGCL